MSLLMVRKSAPAHAADAAPKFRVGQEVIVKTKYTDPYRARIVGLWDMSKNGPYDEQGYLIKNIKGGGVESMPEHALSLATAKDSAADKTEKIANDSEIVALWQVLGDAEAYLREGKKNHNVKNVLAAAIKAAEKENPNDRSVLEAKKVLAQFDADKSEELEREIKGDVVAVVSGNAARVSKDVSFATAKEGVESFARKNGVSVVASQEYGEAYKFKFSAAIDSAAGAAQDFAAMDDFKNPRFISSLTQDVSRLKEKYESALKEGKDNFAYWFRRKVLEEATYLKEIIVEAIATKETSPEEVAKLKPLKDECNKAIQKANAMLSKINSLN